MDDHCNTIFQKPRACAPGGERLIHLEAIRMERAEAEDMKMVFQ
jgi:hypothetical protein